MKPLYYEAHITIYPEDREIAKGVGKMFGFHDSVIYKDEVLGDEKYAYLTKSGDNDIILSAEMAAVCRILIGRDIQPIRRKLEMAIEDELYINECWGPRVK